MYYIIQRKMAKPIKITPILRGKDAVNFLSKMRINKRQTPNSVSKLNEIRRDANIFKSLLKKG